MGDIKVFVAPLLEGTIECTGSASITGVLEGLVEMDGILFVYVARSQVASPSEPPSGDFRRILRVRDLEVAIVCMDRRCVRVAGMDDQADAGSVEGKRVFEIGIEGESRVLRFHLFNGGGGKRSMDDGNVDASLLEDGVRFFQSRGVRDGECAGDTSATFCSGPTIALELWSRRIELFEAAHDFFLEIDHVLRDLVAKRCCHFVETER